MRDDGDRDDDTHSAGGLEGEANGNAVHKAMRSEAAGAERASSNDLRVPVIMMSSMRVIVVVAAAMEQLNAIQHEVGEEPQRGE